jgi:hypothetical protein
MSGQSQACFEPRGGERWRDPFVVAHSLGVPPSVRALTDPL